MADTYKVGTLRDVFENVPEDKWEKLFSDLLKTMRYTKRMNDILELAVPGSTTKWPDVAEWIDDDKSNVTLNYTMPGEEEPFMTFKAESSEDK